MVEDPVAQARLGAESTIAAANERIPILERELEKPRFFPTELSPRYYRLKAEYFGLMALRSRAERALQALDAGNLQAFAFFLDLYAEHQMQQKLPVALVQGVFNLRDELEEIADQRSQPV